MTAAIPSLQLTSVATGLNNPIDVTSAGDGSGRLFAIERAGNVPPVIQNGSLLATPLLNIQSQVITGGERGLLGLAFHPDFATPGAWGERRFYVYYSATTATSGYDSRSII